MALVIWSCVALTFSIILTFALIAALLHHGYKAWSEDGNWASGLATVAFGILFGGFISGLLCKRSIYLLQCGRQLLAGYVIALAPLLESMAAVALFLTIVAGMSALGGLYYPEIALPIAAALLILAGGIAYTRQLLVRLQRSV